MHDLNDRIESLLATVATEVVMPRYRNLHDHEISEKSRGELVTVVDHEAEHRLHAGLAALDPDGRIIGEEACALDPALAEGLGHGRIWIIDPIDGTANFAAGREPFGMMIALIEDGVTRAGWLYDPVSRRFCHAVHGGGAFVDGERLHVAARVRSRPVAALATQFMPAVVRECVERQANEAFALVPIPRCAAEHYPRLALGENDVALFQRTLPWDHAPGALFLCEAGGIVTRWNGTPYCVDDGGVGIVAAANRQDWELAMRTLVPGDPAFPGITTRK